MSCAARRVGGRLPTVIALGVAAVLALGLTAGSGCGAVRVMNARNGVAEQFGCPDARVDEIGSRQLLARGCGRERVYDCSRGWRVCVDLGPRVAQRASALLGCPVQQMQVTVPEPGKFLAAGCGGRVLYRCGVALDGTERCRVELAR